MRTIMSVKILVFLLVLLLPTISLISQNNKSLTKKDPRFGYGLTLSNDLYHRYINPTDNIANGSVGSAILNLGAGPKFWFGGKKMSVSIEGQVVWGILGLSSKDNKGLGTLAVPLMAKLNFGGLSGFEREGKMGFSIGGGIQYSKTELYGLDALYALQGVKRKFFNNYVIQANYGFGLSGFGASGFFRYGIPNVANASAWSVGLQWDFNQPMLKKISNKDSQL